jgi:lysophospholipase L1-like esterase
MNLEIQRTNLRLVKYKVVLIWVLFFFGCLPAQDGGTEKCNYPWIRKEINFIQYHDKSALNSFFQKWQKENSKISIVHLGDSHIQPDIFSGEVRKRLQELKGKGGIGLVFPLSVAKTYTSFDYKSSSTGKWAASRSLESYPKLTLGVFGAAIKTKDQNASFTITFKDALPDNYRRLKIFCKRERQCFDFSVESGGKSTFVYSEPAYGLEVPFVEVDLPAFGNSVTIKLSKKNPYQSEFEFYGMSLESNSASGLVYHCAGIGGARFNAPLHQKLLAKQLPELKPDLVILDYGTNDFLYDDVIKSELYSEIIAVIDSVRKAAPEASILLTTAQDMYYKNRNVNSSVQFSEMIRKIAKQKNCAFYDWFWISGGLRSITKWAEAGIAQKDRIHLNIPGYRIKGKLFADAIITAISQIAQNKDEMILPLNLVVPVYDSLAPDTEKFLPVKTESIKHKVKKGESLSIIARKYHVSISQLMKWNQLKKEKITIGQVLVVKK